MAGKAKVCESGIVKPFVKHIEVADRLMALHIAGDCLLYLVICLRPLHTDAGTLLKTYFQLSV